MKKIPKNEITSRCENLRNCLAGNGVDFCLILQNISRFYFSGTMQDGVLLLHKDHEPVLFVKRTLERAKRESPVKLIKGFNGIGEIQAYIHDHNLKSSVIGLEMDILPAKMYQSFLSLFPEARFVDISMDIRSIRAVKSKYEISCLIEGGRKLDSVFLKLKAEFDPGITELELHMKLNELFLEEGSSLIVRARRFNMEVFPSTVLSGASASLHSMMDSPSGGGEGICTAYPFGAGFKNLGKGEPVLIDVAFNNEGYIVDCTRIFSIGSLDQAFIKAHGVSMDIHRMFTEKIVSQKTVSEICTDIHRYVEKQGLSGEFMGGANFIGHGVGLELDELPIINSRFESRLIEGMVVAFEPKFVFENGCVGFEDTYYIEQRNIISVNNTERSIHFM
jgi:Xaa-Pro aminopeptidase